MIEQKVSGMFSCADFGRCKQQFSYDRDGRIRCRDKAVGAHGYCTKCGDENEKKLRKELEGLEERVAELKTELSKFAKRPT